MSISIPTKRASPFPKLRCEAIDEGEHEEREGGIEAVVLERHVERRLDGGLLCTVDGVGIDGDAV